MEGKISDSLANQNKRKKPIEPNQNVDLVMKTNGKDKPEDKPSTDTTPLITESKEMKHNTSRKTISTDLNYEPEDQFLSTPTYRIDHNISEIFDSNQCSPINTRALQKIAITYELEKFEKNALLIFNQEYIVNKEPRFGTQVDVDALMNTFEKFGFEVKDNVHRDLNKKDILNKVKEFTSKDFTDYGCVGIVVLTHGFSKGRLWAKDTYYKELDIIDYLKVSNNRTLVTKPKFIIIQACRGNAIKNPVLVTTGSKNISTDHTDLELYHLPEEADTLMLHSCYDGCMSFRDRVKGTWFIEMLYKTVDQLASSHDFVSIMTEVMRRVAIDKFQQESDYIPEYERTCQMPILTSTLTRKLYFKKFGDAKPLDDSSVLPVVSGIAGEQATTVQRSSRQAPVFGPCVCFLDHFEYIRNCLRHFVKSNPDDKESKYLLDLAEEYQGPEVDACKIHMIKIIQIHLMNNAKGADYYNYLHLFVYDN